MIEIQNLNGYCTVISLSVDVDVSVDSTTSFALPTSTGFYTNCHQVFARFFYYSNLDNHDGVCSITITEIGLTFQLGVLRHYICHELSRHLQDRKILLGLRRRQQLSRISSIEGRSVRIINRLIFQKLAGQTSFVTNPTTSWKFIYHPPSIFSFPQRHSITADFTYYTNAHPRIRISSN